MSQRVWTLRTDRHTRADGSAYKYTVAFGPSLGSFETLEVVPKTVADELAAAAEKLLSRLNLADDWLDPALERYRNEVDGA